MSAVLVTGVNGCVGLSSLETKSPQQVNSKVLGACPVYSARPSTWAGLEATLDSLRLFLRYFTITK